MRGSFPILIKTSRSSRRIRILSYWTSVCTIQASGKVARRFLKLAAATDRGAATPKTLLPGALPWETPDFLEHA